VRNSRFHNRKLLHIYANGALPTVVPSNSIEEVLIEMYLTGVSVRWVEDITETLRGTRVSSGTVSKLNQKVYKHIEA